MLQQGGGGGAAHTLDVGIFSFSTRSEVQERPLLLGAVLWPEAALVTSLSHWRVHSHESTTTAANLG